MSERRLLPYPKRVLKQLELEGVLHTLVSHALSRGMPEAVVRQWIGQVAPEVTRIYTHVTHEVSRAAIMQQLICHAAIETPMTYSVGLDADRLASNLWRDLPESSEGDKSGDTKTVAENAASTEIESQ